MAKRKKFKQSSTRTLATPSTPTTPIIHHSLVDKNGYYRVDEYGNIISVQQEPTPHGSKQYHGVEPGLLANLPKAPAGFDPIHLAIAASQPAEPQPEAKSELSWSYNREAPPPIKIFQPSADPIVNCPHCTRQLPRSRLERHINQAHPIDPIVNCPYCNLRGRRSQLENHIEYEHPAPPVDPMVPCPRCTAQIRQSNLDAHMAKVHQAQPAKSQPNATSRANLVNAVLRAIGKPEAALAPIPPTATKATPAPKPKPPNAIPDTDRSSRTDLTVCPICKASVRSDRLDGHLNKVHQQVNRTAFVPPASKVANTTKGKGRPIKIHQQPQPLMSAKLMSKTSGQRNQLPPRPNTNEKSQAAFDQAFHEKRFGDKYVGQSRREGSGRFGSLPLYDDYGDEADAD